MNHEFIELDIALSPIPDGFELDALLSFLQLYCRYYPLHVSPDVVLGNATDTEASLSALVSWNDTEDFCQCAVSSAVQDSRRVIGLEFWGMKLAGSLSPSTREPLFPTTNLANSLRGNTLLKLGISLDFDLLQ